MKKKYVLVPHSGNSSLRLLYETKGGRLILKAVINPVASEVMGRLLSTGASASLIPAFVKKNGIDKAKYENRTYHSYNDFFTRKLAISPVFENNDNALCSPCEAFLSVHRISKDSIFNIKDTNYSVSDLLCSKSLADLYVDGYCLIFRLAVSNYHRYCFFDSGRVLRSRTIKGSLHTVRPIAFEHFDVFKHNSREYTVMETDHFGLAVQIEVGALLVGRIVNHGGITRFEKGQEKGFFEFGGSTVVLLLRPGAAEINRQILNNTRNGVETPVSVGQEIGAVYKPL